MPYWLVTMFDDNKIKNQFHVAGESAIAALKESASILSDKNAHGFDPSEVHLQLIKNRDGKVT